MPEPTHFLNVPISLWIAMIAQFGAITAAVAAGFINIRREVRSTTSEIKVHQDVSVQKLNGMLTAVIHSFDRPAWIKVARHEPDGSVRFIMLEVNERYSEMFGIDRHDYIGKTDLEAGWDHETAKAFYDHDLMVWASGEPTSFVEYVRGVKMRFRKLRLRTLDGKTKGIMGYQVDCGDYKCCPLYAGALTELVDEEVIDEAIQTYESGGDQTRVLKAKLEGIGVPSCEVDV